MMYGAIGCGNMGGAVIAGLAQIENCKIVGYDHNIDKLEKLHEAHNMKICYDELEVVKEADIILIGVKPYAVEKTILKILPALNENKIIVSMAAGISIEKIKNMINDVCPVITIMPNTPAIVGCACCAICLDDEKLTKSLKDKIVDDFSKFSMTTVLKESDFPQFSALFGSGPAFVFYFQEAMQEAAIRLGFSQKDSKKLIDQLFLGCAKLSLHENDVDYAKLRLNVCSPKGSSIVGMNTLDEKAVRGSIITAITQTYNRILEMYNN